MPPLSDQVSDPAEKVKGNREIVVLMHTFDISPDNSSLHPIISVSVPVKDHTKAGALEEKWGRGQAKKKCSRKR